MSVKEELRAAEERERLAFLAAHRRVPDLSRAAAVDAARLGVRQHALEGGHDTAAVDDLVLRNGEGRLELVEIRPDRPGRAGVLERVAARALALEDLLAVRAADHLRRGEALHAGVGGDEGG